MSDLRRLKNLQIRAFFTKKSSCVLVLKYGYSKYSLMFSVPGSRLPFFLKGSIQRRSLCRRLYFLSIVLEKLNKNGFLL